ncbi:hypothetical protein [Dyadobacter jiangsuensis]|uniref:Uncharacterized protein n=1 Tax=Dyadobacter jiangsuensis TaxID=1591085 RepID=A0A2P8FNB2_9BACT|nr:hypothetical protein [Dyadobacter jiangsuensis]PSL23173.1 hypothetical protein CLV60_11750 [Dyadobacter jiangsuensis]
MEQILTAKLKSRVKNLAWYQIAGGALGIVMFIYALTQTGVIEGITLLLIATGIFLYGFSIYCGRLLTRGEIRNGLYMSKINQVLQIVQFAVGGYAYLYVSGASAVFKIDLSSGTDLGFEVGPSNLNLTIHKQEELVVLGINILAIYLTYYIIRMEEEIAERELLIKTPVEDPKIDAISATNTPDPL